MDDSLSQTGRRTNRSCCLPVRTNARRIVKASRREVPRHCRAGDLDEAEKLDALPSHERLLLDVIRMIAYRAETRMMLPVMQAQGKKAHPRKLLRALLAADADILPDPAQWRPQGAHSRPRK